MLPLVSFETAGCFATVVIEVPKPSYHSQSKTSMFTASLKAGGSTYRGPQRLCLPRWKHIQTFYVFDLSAENYYQAASLSHHPHYSILKSELEEFNSALTKFQSQHRSCKIKRVTATENFQDDFLLVINDFSKYPCLQKMVDAIDDTNLLQELLTQGKLDMNRGNWKLDFGYASGQNLERDLLEFGVTRPRILDRTTEPQFLGVQTQLSQISDQVSESFGLPLYHREENIHQRYAAKLNPLGLFPAWRVAGHGPKAFVEVHEDFLNESRPLMSPVGVLSRIYQTEDGPLRLTKIGYSPQSLLDSERRESNLKPIVKQFIEWERKQPDYMRTVSPVLFQRKPNSQTGVAKGTARKCQKGAIHWK
jgi:hypothetical protein